MFNFSKLGIPIIQAPMAGGINNPRLASEVSNAGGVGSFGFSYSTRQKISEDLVATRALTDGRGQYSTGANSFEWQIGHHLSEYQLSRMHDHPRQITSANDDLSTKSNSNRGHRKNRIYS